jgi:hypothetical protein
MKPQTKKRLVLGGIALTVIALAAWAIHQHKKNNPKNSSASPMPVSTSRSSSSLPPNPIGNNDRVLAFQKFANSRGYLPKLVEDGLWGPKTAEAWKVHELAFTNSTMFHPPLLVV